MQLIQPVTELAETLVRRERLPFRVAHAIVARSVHHATEAGTPLNHYIFQASAREILGRELALSHEQLTEAIDPAYFVRYPQHTWRTCCGGNKTRVRC